MASTYTPPAPPAPPIIQGGMGVAISDWRLAGAVAATGQLGVVAGTALDVVCARRLQRGDPGGHVRRALAAFPVPAVAARVLAAYYVEGGIPAGASFRTVPLWTLRPSRALQELTVVANFVEVFLAKQGASGPVGINLLRKIELPTPFACYGAMLADVDYVLVGAGNPADMPPLLRTLAEHRPVAFEVKVAGATSADGASAVRCSPRALLGTGLPPLRTPKFLAIVASVDLAAGLANSPDHRPDGFVVEGPTAGGHNAPPRGPRRTNAAGEPVYDARDEVDLDEIAALGLPFWLAGSYGTPGALRRAQAAGATGVQVGTVFAFCSESGMAADLKVRVVDELSTGGPVVTSDWRASPTGFPFKVVHLAGTLSEDSVHDARREVCDLAFLRSPYRTAAGEVDYRCPAEPTRVYLSRKGGRPANTEGRRCLCNALLATAGLPQQRPNGYIEPALVTAGDDFTAVAELSAARPDAPYTAADVVDHLLTGVS
jgi:NAD(P)H-dependent flavin oxidoreductase YrpB (nitropropane dioxygenase family)